jgi:hypothetical protein
MAADNFGQARNTKKPKSSEQTQLPKPRSPEQNLERAWPSPVGPLMPSTLAGDDGFHFSARARALDRGRALRKRHQCQPATAQIECSEAMSITTSTELHQPAIACLKRARSKR